MSDWFDELVEQSVEVADISEKPDINDYVYDYDPEFLEAWNIAPVEDMTEGQILGMIDTLIGLDWDSTEWGDVLAEMQADYWEWFREEY